MKWLGAVLVASVPQENTKDAELDKNKLHTKKRLSLYGSPYTVMSSNPGR